MKKLNILLLLLTVTFLGCGKSEQAADTVVESASVESTVTQTEDAPQEEEQIDEATQVEADSSVDLDLTALSSTMVYSEVFNMMMDPESYEGKSIKMDGNCAIYTDEETGQTYYACIVQDATQCCSQGLEFVLDENEYSAEDYPTEGEEIVIKGTFSAYTEGEYMYITIKDSVLE